MLVLAQDVWVSIVGLGQLIGRKDSTSLTQLVDGLWRRGVSVFFLVFFGGFVYIFYYVRLGRFANLSCDKNEPHTPLKKTSRASLRSVSKTFLVSYSRICSSTLI